ncbi:hypothetical protein Y1Q_0004293 [Alligator mississippiensis]|uniref:Uncharacterized protein n=1 Tax=Alligator mississippiensis TaxID=8496 RepID=A0A151MI94_ALLMI|nr:hypothetical protein Y1Q_0004293 [Alligator mississippiensis]
MVCSMHTGQSLDIFVLQKDPSYSGSWNWFLHKGSEQSPGSSCCLLHTGTSGRVLQGLLPLNTAVSP